jgi:hypothetical protein
VRVENRRVGNKNACIKEKRRGKGKRGGEVRVVCVDTKIKKVRGERRKERTKAEEKGGEKECTSRRYS